LALGRPVAVEEDVALVDEGVWDEDGDEAAGGADEGDVGMDVDMADSIEEGPVDMEGDVDELAILLRARLSERMEEGCRWPIRMY
jgi:hypothetical protein